ncbi:MAG: cysteine desulfurase family protein [Planctomycetota bacterium]
MPDATPIYLDHNATSPVLPAAADAVRDAMLRLPGNPGSQHAAGRTARRELEAARERILTLLGAQTDGLDADRLLFTSGGTESNNLALRSFFRSPSGEAGPPHLVISSIEHPSVDATAAQLEAEGVAVDRAPVDRSGVVLVDRLAELLRPTTRLVSVMLANNETGVLQPLEPIAALCQQRGVPLHTDATQAVGKVAVDFARLGATLLTFTAHKFHGPWGVGGLLVRAGTPPLVGFGGQPGAERPGTPTVALAIGMETALGAWHDEAAGREARLGRLRDRFESLILRDLPKTVVVGAAASRLPHTSNLAFVGLNRQALQMALDRAGVQCSTGSACASGSSEPSPPLLAMGLEKAVVQGALRFSLGAMTTEDDVQQAAARVVTACRRMGRGK